MKSSFHLQQNTTPDRLKSILNAAVDKCVNSAEIAAECNLKLSVLNKLVLPFIHHLGLIQNNSLSLTDLGIQFYELSKKSTALFSESVHHLLYTAHRFDMSKCFSWAYARIVNILWGSKEVLLDSRTTAQLVGIIVEEAERTFSIPVERIAFSAHSIRGALNWLRALEPPVVNKRGKEDYFNLRYYCSPQSFLWAVDFLYRTNDISYGVRMFLTPERIEQLCKQCLLDPSGLDNVLIITKRTSDYDRGGIFDYGLEGGFGQWILLTHPSAVPTMIE